MHHLSKILLFFVTIFFVITSFAEESLLPNESSDKCEDNLAKDCLVSGWYLAEPYQFNQSTPSGYRLTGMDIELIKDLSSRVNVQITFSEVQWRQHMLDLINGNKDVAFGATYTDARAQYMHFSLPYRFEEDSLFIHKRHKKRLDFNNITELLVQLRLENIKIGVIKGFVYADKALNDFINDPINKDLIFFRDNDLLNLQSLLRQEIDGFITDRVVGAALILNNNSGEKVIERRLNVKTPIHLMFSKKTVPLSMVERYNKAIKDFVMNDEYKSIVRTYLYPILVMQTINADWFFILSMIGTIAFALSGVAIAVKENVTLFGTLLLALLPSLGGGILRDTIISRNQPAIILSPYFLYCVIIIVIISFFLVRLFVLYRKTELIDQQTAIFWSHVLIVFDALGQAAFIVNGVALVILHHIDNIIFWGPFFAFVTANGGGILRDLLRKDRIISCLSGEVNAEISIIWGLIFAVFLQYSAYSPNQDNIKYAVIIVVLGAFFSRLIAHYTKIPNLYFMFQDKSLVVTGSTHCE